MKAELVKNTLIIGLGKLSTQLVTFILLPIYTIYLSPEHFGVVDLIISYVTLTAPLIMAQLDRSAFRLLIDVRGDVHKSGKVISNTLTLVLGALTCVVAVYGIFNLFFHVPYSWLIIFAVIFSIFSNLFLQFSRGIGKNLQFALASVLIGAVNLIVSLVLVVGFKFGVEGVLSATIVSQCAAVIYLFANLKLYKYISFKSGSSSAKIKKELLSFAWPLVPTAVSWWFIRTFDRTLVTIFLGIAANGMYAVANRYALIFNALYSIFDLSWSESASSNINSKDRDKFFSDVYNTSFRFFGALGLMMLVMTPFIFNIVIGEQFQETYKYIPILLVGGLFNAAVDQYNVIYIAKKKTKQVLLTSIVAAAISVALNMLLIPIYGISGAAIALAASFLTMAIWRHFDIKKYVKVTFTGNIFIKLSVAYTFSILLYYANNTYADIANLLITGFVSFRLSKNVILGGFRATFAKVCGIKRQQGRTLF